MLDEKWRLSELDVLNDSITSFGDCLRVRKGIVETKRAKVNDNLLNAINGTNHVL